MIMIDRKKLMLGVVALAAIFTTSSALANSGAYCREYTERFQIGGRTQQGYGTACLQPDGSWEKQQAQNTAYNNNYERQKQNVVYVIDRQPVEIYRPYYPRYNYIRPQPYYSQPTTFFTVSFGGNNYRNERYGYRGYGNHRDYHRGYHAGHGGYHRGHGGGYWHH